ncbi:MAG: thiamine-phosphate kinase [Maricaulaceae bacterium]
MTEFDFIADYLAPLAGPEGLGLLDDAALFTPAAGMDLVITKDTLVEGVHVPMGFRGADIAERLLRTNLSDLAAKGAVPIGYLLSLALPKDMTEAAMRGFALGLSAVQETFAPLRLFGGDTVRIGGPMVVTATLIGSVPHGKMIRRSGAQIGDDIWVSGVIGESAMGLKHVLSQKIDPPPSGEAIWAWEEAYLRPQPRLALGQALRDIASASADVSDGLLADVGHIAKASGVGMTIDLSTVPFSKAGEVWMAGQDDPRAARLELLTAGDDYELVFTAPAAKRAELKALGETLGLPLSRIGQCESGQGESGQGENGQRVALFAADGSVIDVPRRGYSHF